MTFSVIIPARYASTRLPGKALVDIAGKPMIQHVYERAMESDAKRVIIATDDQRIVDAATAFGAQCCMTSSTCESGTDRLQEVVETLNFSSDEIVVNVQGDEPLIPPAIINQVAADLISSKNSELSTLVKKINSIETVLDPNAVKVTIDNNGRALYFSRAPIPWDRDGWSDTTGIENRSLPESASYYRHIGIYAYRVSFLHKFVAWPSSALERIEKLEQLRALENGAEIAVSLVTETIPPGIDTQQDLDQVRAMFYEHV